MRQIVSIAKRTRGRQQLLDKPEGGWGGVDLDLDEGSYIFVVGAICAPIDTEQIIEGPVDSVAVTVALQLVEKQSSSWEGLLDSYRKGLAERDAEIKLLKEEIGQLQSQHESSTLRAAAVAAGGEFAKAAAPHIPSLIARLTKAFEEAK